MYKTEEEQTLLLIRSLSLRPCFNMAEAEFPQRTWLIRRSTNTANYSLMPLSENQFSQRHSPVPRETDARLFSHHHRMNKEKWGLSKLLPINESLSFELCHSEHITSVLISTALRTLIVMTYHWHAWKVLNALNVYFLLFYFMFAFTVSYCITVILTII